MVAAAPTTVAAIATEATVSGSAEDTKDTLLLCSCGFTSTENKKGIQCIEDHHVRRKINYKH